MKAMTEPLNEIEPMIVPRTIEITTPRDRSWWAPVNSATETSAAVAPPMPLKTATLCGIAVILTRRDG